MHKDYEGYIDKQLNETLQDKLVRHRDSFKRMFRARFMEMIPSLIQYRNDHTVSIDFLKVEVALRNGYDIVLGETTNRNLQVIGFMTSQQTSENPADLFSGKTLKHKDISFVIPEHLRLDYYQEISHQDQCQTGNFVVLRNKTVQYVNDHSIINYYIDELAEIVLSRFSISMQVKISTLFSSEVNDESINKLITEIYNGNPYIKVGKLFDPEDNIYHMQNEGLANNFQELKKEYQNKMSEFINMLGMNALAVEKESGVSDTEAQSNRAFTTTNANIYLDARNGGLERLNKRYNLQLEAMYNDEVVSEFEDLHQAQEKESNEGGDNSDNNNAV